MLAEAEFPAVSASTWWSGPAVYIDEPVVVGIDEGRNLAIAYRADKLLRGRSGATALSRRLASPTCRPTR